MKSPFDKAIKSFRKQIKKLSKEEIEERLNKYKIMGDLTDKIDVENISKHVIALLKEDGYKVEYNSGDPREPESYYIVKGWVN